MTTFLSSRPVSSRLRRTAALGALACVGLLPSCGSSSSAAPSAPSSGSVSSTPATAAASAPASGTLPAVDGASDLSRQPTIHAGGDAKPSTLLTHDLVVGTGPAATAQDTVTVAYVGSNFVDGKVFDASWTSGQPAQFSLAGGVIPGFTQGIAGMKVGGRREIVIPPALGYGDQAQGPIVANETLVFVVDLKSIP